MAKKYVIRLTDEEREELEGMVSKGKASAHRIRHAHLLLAVDADGPCWTDEQAAGAYRCHRGTVENVRRRFVEEGLESALERKKRPTPPRERILDGDKEARLIALACSRPPEGRARWTLSLLRDKLVMLDVVESIGVQTVRRALKKTNSNRTCASAG